MLDTDSVQIYEELWGIYEDNNLYMMLLILVDLGSKAKNSSCKVVAEQ